MEQLKDKASLTSRVIKTDQVNWREFLFIQQQDFKELPLADRNRLKASILANNFTQPFYVWEDPATGSIYCLDGKDRCIILEELAWEGHDIPDLLPATYITCRDKTEAARMVLIYSSMYAKITMQGFHDFLLTYDLNYAEVKDHVSFPDFSSDRFEQKFDIFGVTDLEEYEEDLPAEEDVIVRAGDIFQLGDHKVMCASFFCKGVMDRLMDGDQARIMITDPPYNLPTHVFTNFTEQRFENFAMAAGEMTDIEFVNFLMLIMQTAVVYTVRGGIHYIFMDWRHTWHMTEASRIIYGSAIPKQMCVWVKDHMANGSFYRSQQELCFVFASEGAKNLWNRDLLDEGGGYKDNNELIFIFKNGEGAKHLSHLDLVDRTRTNVWKYPSANSTKNPDRYLLKDHPTPKPVAMIADAILDTTDPGEIVLDLFLGSGTAVIAAEKTGRRCFGTEISPRYVQAIIKRYIQYCTRNGKEVQFRHCNGSITLNHLSHVPATPHLSPNLKNHE